MGDRVSVAQEAKLCVKLAEVAQTARQPPFEVVAFLRMLVRMWVSWLMTLIQILIGVRSAL